MTVSEFLDALRQMTASEVDAKIGKARALISREEAAECRRGGLDAPQEAAKVPPFFH